MLSGCRRRFIIYQDPPIRNNLPVNIKKSKDLHKFKACLKKFLLNPYVQLVLLGYVTVT